MIRIVEPIDELLALAVFQKRPRRQSLLPPDMKHEWSEWNQSFVRVGGHVQEDIGNGARAYESGGQTEL